VSLGVLVVARWYLCCCKGGISGFYAVSMQLLGILGCCYAVAWVLWMTARVLVGVLVVTLPLLYAMGSCWVVVRRLLCSFWVF